MANYTTPNYTIAFTVAENAWTHDLVFLNGNLATGRWWMPTVEALKAQQSSAPKTGRMIFIELPGCGDSSKVTSDLDLNELTNHYLDLLKTLHVQKASVIGHSTGGFLGCLMMARKPELFHKSLLLDPVGAKGIQFENSVLEKYEEMKTNRELTAMIIGFTILNCDMQSPFFKDVIVEDTYRSVNNLGSKMILALRGINFEEEIQKVQTPTTILYGQQDVLLPKADFHRLAELIPSAKITEVENTGHCMNLENPAKMASFIQAELS